MGNSQRKEKSMGRKISIKTVRKQNNESRAAMKEQQGKQNVKNLELKRKRGQSRQSMNKENRFNVNKIAESGKERGIDELSTERIGSQNIDWNENLTN